jgi:hypothetical protein
MVASGIPAGTILQITAQTDRGTRKGEFPFPGEHKKEFHLALKGAKKIRKIRLEIHTRTDGPGSGWFYWIGLQNSRRLPEYLAQWNRFDPTWEDYLKPENYEPKFEPAQGLFLTKKEIDTIRKSHSGYVAAGGKSPFLSLKKEYKAPPPEQMIGDFVTHVFMFCRDRDIDKQYLLNGTQLATAGLILKDKHLLRLAARYAMALAMCGRWDDGMVCFFPGSSFEHRAFVKHLCVENAAVILDLAGELFTDLGRDVLLRRIADEGIGSINYVTWRYEYIHRCNQLSAFSPGRMAGYALLEKTMPRVKPYMELAYRDIVENIEQIILSDGGFVEGPRYLAFTFNAAMSALYYYSRAKETEFEKVIPKVFKKLAAYAQAIASTTDTEDVITVCDAAGGAIGYALPFFAAAMPKSYWVTMYRKSVRNSGIAPSALAWLLDKKIPRKGPEPHPFADLPKVGLMASTRKFKKEWVKLLILGNKAGAGHTHEDKGSFILEFAGETFAIDPGMCLYENPLAVILKQCQRHNMLVPYGLAERPHPASPLPANIAPKGKGNNTRFSAAMDLAAGWEDFYTKWTRKWDSPTPEVLTIRDEYELKKGDGVEFYWNTKLDVQIGPRAVTISGKRGKATIEIPRECLVRLDELPLADNSIQRRIAFQKQGRKGTLEIKVKLQIKD